MRLMTGQSEEAIDGMKIHLVLLEVKYSILSIMVLKPKLDSGSIKTSPRDGLRAIGKETTPNCATLGHSDLL